MEIQNAEKFQSLSIARLIMQAMNYDCCRYFTGPDHTLDEFERLMTKLVLDDSSQYSYRNTLVALNGIGGLCGMCVSYNGALLHKLREPFVSGVKECFGTDLSGMGDETSAGELYIDSIAVPEDCRGKGVATALLNATIDKATAMGINTVGLLVDKANPKAEKLYNKVGFRFVNDTEWGGHKMKHLQYKIK